MRLLTAGDRKSSPENAQQISDLGKELYDRLRTMAGHFDKVGKSLDAAVRSYNDTVGSYEKRVLVSARKFSELGATTKEDIQELEPIERSARAVVGDTGQLTFEENNSR